MKHILIKLTHYGRKFVSRGQRLIDNVFYAPLKPECIVIGAQKGGTSALFRYLSYHHAVAPPKRKEINFFSCNSRYSRGLKFYHSYFPGKSPSNSSKITFDVTPDYLIAADKAAKRIFSYNPNIKLIALLRNPITRAHSAWQMYRRYQQRNNEWFYDWVQMCESSIQREFFVSRPPSFGQCFEDDILDEIDAMEQGRTIEMPMLRHGLYCQQLKIYFNYFSRQQVLILSSEQFLRDTLAELRKIEAFLGLEKHSWSEGQLKPYSVGQYDEIISQAAHDILKSFYQEHNEALCFLLNREFEWT